MRESSEPVPYNELSREELEEELEHFETKAAKLEKKLSRQRAEYLDLQDDFTFQKNKAEDLELQLVEKRSKFSQITKVLESRGEPSELEAQLMQKSVELAETNLSLDRKRLELQRADDQIDELEAEVDALKECNDNLSLEYEKKTTELDKTKRDKAMSNQLLSELGGILKLLRPSLSSGRQSSGKKERDRESLSSHADTIQQLREAVQAMVRENSSSPRKGSIGSEGHTETTHTDLSPSSIASRDNDFTHEVRPRNRQNILRSQSTPFSVDTRLLDEHAQDDDCSEEDEVSVGIPTKDFEKIKAELEVAEAKIVNMSADIGRAKAAEQECEEAIQKISDLENQLSRAQAERADAYKEVSTLEHELEEAEKAIEAATTKATEMKETFEKLLTEKTAENKALKEKCDEFESGYSQQMLELEKQVEESERFFRIKCEGLKEQHLTKVDEITTKYDELKKDHEKTIVSQKERFDQLNLEFDTFMEMHTQLEDDMAELQSKYEEALNKIIALEEQLEAAKKEHSRDNKKNSAVIADLKSTVEEMKKAAEASKTSMQEAILNQQKLRRDNEKRVAELDSQLESAKKDSEEKTQVVDELKDLMCDMEERLKRAEKSTTTQITLLEESYASSMSKVREYAERLHDAGLMADTEVSVLEVSSEEEVRDPPNQEKAQTKSKHDIAAEKMQRLEDELSKKSEKKTAEKEAKEPTRFQKDLSSILADVSKMEVSDPEKHDSSWFLRLLHSTNLVKLHAELPIPDDDDDQHPAVPTEVEDDSMVADLLKHFTWKKLVNSQIIANVPRFGSERPAKNTKDFLTHLEKTRSVHKQLEQHRLLGGAPQESNTDDKSLYSINTFINHQRHLNALHFDLMTYARACGISDPAISSAQSIQSLPAPRLDGPSGEGPNSIEEAKTQLQQLKGEARKIKLAADTSKIRFEAREKEHRVVLFQYKNLLNEVNEIKSQQNEEQQSKKIPPSTTSNKGVTASNKGATTPFTTSAALPESLPMSRLRKDLRAAELKVEMMAMELRSTKSKADEAQKNFELGEQKLQTVLGRYEELQSEQQSLQSKLQQSQAEKHQAQPQIFRPPRSPTRPNTQTMPTVASFDGSHLTSFSEGVSAEGRDEKGDRERVHLENDTESGPLLLPASDNSDMHTARAVMSRLQAELVKAENVAREAKEKLREREDDLREVIAQYKELKAEYDVMVKLSQAAEKSNQQESVDHEAIARERDVARAQIAVLENDLEKVTAVAKSVRKKQLLREDHLRQVIDQYKELETEHKATKEQLQRALQARSRVEAPLSPHIEVQQAAAKSKGERKGSQGNSNNPRWKRKPWFSDIKFARDQAASSDERQSGSFQGAKKALARVRRI